MTGRTAHLGKALDLGQHLAYVLRLAHVGGALVVQLIVGVNHKTPDAVPAGRHLPEHGVGSLRQSHSWDQLLFRPWTLMQNKSRTK